MVICIKAGERPKCQGGECEHSFPHAYNPLKGCGGGRCFPDTVVKNTITGDDEIVRNNLECIDIAVSSEVQNESFRKKELLQEDEKLPGKA